MEQKPATTDVEGGATLPPLVNIFSRLIRVHMDFILIQLLLGQILNCFGWAISLHRGNAALG